MICIINVEAAAVVVECMFASCTNKQKMVVVVLGVFVSSGHVVICVIETLKQQLILLANGRASGARNYWFLFRKVSVKIRDISFVVLGKSGKSTLVVKGNFYFNSTHQCRFKRWLHFALFILAPVDTGKPWL